MEEKTPLDGTGGAKIPVDVSALDALRKKAVNVKRMGRQAVESADELIVQIDKLKQQATASKT